MEVLRAGQDLGVEGDHGAGHPGVSGVVGVDLVDGQPVLVAVDGRAQGIGRGQTQGRGLLMDETADGLEAWAELQGGEVGGDDDRRALQARGDEVEVMVDRLLDQLTLRGEEGGVVQAQADRDDVGLATQNRFQPGGVTA